MSPERNGVNGESVFLDFLGQAEFNSREPRPTVPVNAVVRLGSWENICEIAEKTDRWLFRISRASLVAFDI